MATRGGLREGSGIGCCGPIGLLQGCNSAYRVHSKSCMAQSSTAVETTTEDISGISDLTVHLRMMLLIRRFEERLDDLFASGVIKGTSHLYAGQEAVAVGVCAVLTHSDFITSTHRG